MSFSQPRNVSSFSNQHYPSEDTTWRSSGHSRSHNGHSRSGIGGKVDGFFEKQQLPMYKDKPYSYAASRRKQPFYKQWQAMLGAGCFVLGFMYWFFLSGSSAPATVKSKGTSAWGWMGGPGAATVDWDSRRERVKEAFTLSWDGYAQYAWGYDEYHPISKTGKQMTEKGLGWIIVDALDTLMLMNLTSRLSHAREWISTTLDYEQDHEVNTFETTIRMLGGLLSAHYLSTTFPDMAPLADDDKGAPGEDLYLEKAADLADRILGAFESESGIPYASINLKTLKGIPSHVDDGASSTAEAATLQLELKYLAFLTGEKNYWDRAEKVMQIIDDNGIEDGLVPIFIYANLGHFRGDNIRLGSRGDSYYEYLIKQYLQTSYQEPIYLDMWNQALAGVRKHLLVYSSPSHFTVLGERPSGLSGALSPKMDHLVCFMPGTIALGATGGLTVEEAKKAGKWGKKEEEELELAIELTKTCWGMYKVTATGLAPEITFFETGDNPQAPQTGKLTSAEISSSSGSWKQDFIVKPQDSHNLQRPETVETLFYMWRITGDDKYREWGWEMFKSYVKYSAADDGAGFTSLNNVNEIPPMLRDNMESFWLAETLKYFYLLFSPRELLPLDSIVINTEAHVFPRFELKRGLKTGWERKPRDADGRIMQPKAGDRKPKTGGKEKEEKKAVVKEAKKEEKQATIQTVEVTKTVSVKKEEKTGEAKVEGRAFQGR